MASSPPRSACAVFFFISFCVPHARTQCTTWGDAAVVITSACPATLSSFTSLTGTTTITISGEGVLTCEGNQTIRFPPGTSLQVEKGGLVKALPDDKDGLISLQGLQRLVVRGEVRAAVLSVTASEVVVNASGSIHADKLGYLAGNGPSGATLANQWSPATAGSGGSGTNGGAGGGVVSITARTCVVNGRVSADGGDSSGHTDSGGAGGSVWLKVSQLSGTGIIAAAGGDSGRHSAGSRGSDGYIAVTPPTANSTMAVALPTLHGVELTAHTVSLGTASRPLSLLLRRPLRPTAHTIAIRGSQLSIDTFNSAPVPFSSFSAVASRSLLLNGTLEARTVTLTAPIIWLTFTAEVTLGRGSALTLASSHSLVVNGTLKASNLTLTAPLITVSATAVVSADGRAPSNGPGEGSNGGRHAHVYGNSRQPVTAGSRGGGSVTHGGGVIRIRASSLLTLHGSVSADGAQGFFSVFRRTKIASGSGGSVWLTAGDVRGSGVVSADGGSGGRDSAPGGGGYVAIEYTGTALLSCALQLSAGVVTFVMAPSSSSSDTGSGGSGVAPSLRLSAAIRPSLALAVHAPRGLSTLSVDTALHDTALSYTGRPVHSLVVTARGLLQLPRASGLVLTVCCAGTVSISGTIRAPRGNLNMTARRVTVASSGTIEAASASSVVSLTSSSLLEVWGTVASTGHVVQLRAARLLGNGKIHTIGGSGGGAVSVTITGSEPAIFPFACVAESLAISTPYSASSLTLSGNINSSLPLLLPSPPPSVLNITGQLTLAMPFAVGGASHVLLPRGGAIMASAVHLSAARLSLAGSIAATGSVQITAQAITGSGRIVAHSAAVNITTGSDTLALHVRCRSLFLASTAPASPRHLIVSGSLTQLGWSQPTRVDASIEQLTLSGGIRTAASLLLRCQSLTILPTGQLRSQTAPPATAPIPILSLTLSASLVVRGELAAAAVDITVPSLLVSATGRLHADASRQRGPGMPTQSGIGASHARSGSLHGGTPLLYGDPLTPTTPGSAGSATNLGGGTVAVKAQRLEVQGRVSADGGSGATGGGGSGGSVLLYVPALLGGGTVCALGGAGSDKTSATAGSDGRVAVHMSAGSQLNLALRSGSVAIVTAAQPSFTITHPITASVSFHPPLAVQSLSIATTVAAALMNFTACQSLVVESTGALVTDGLGWGPASGPGAPPPSQSLQLGTGASHATYGSTASGLSSSAFVYGSAAATPTAGSGGGNGYAANREVRASGGAGGGVVSISCDRVELWGPVSCRGAVGEGMQPNAAAYRGGGGSGGSIHVASRSLHGNATLSVRGGGGLSLYPPAPAVPGAGGDGWLRLAVSERMAFRGHIDASVILLTPPAIGTALTVQPASVPVTLSLFQPLLRFADDVTLVSLSLLATPQLPLTTRPGATVRIANTTTLRCSANHTLSLSTLHLLVVSGSIRCGAIHIQADELIVTQGGVVSAAGMGRAPSTTSTQWLAAFFSSGPAHRTVGGAGWWAGHRYASSAAVYGSPQAPLNSGHSGQSTGLEGIFAEGGLGGGMIAIHSLSATIYGTVSADATDGAFVPGLICAPGGSGGSIVFNASRVQGTGTISAVGGYGGHVSADHLCGFGGDGRLMWQPLMDDSAFFAPPLPPWQLLFEEDTTCGMTITSGVLSWYPPVVQWPPAITHYEVWVGAAALWSPGSSRPPPADYTTQAASVKLRDLPNGRSTDISVAAVSAAGRSRPARSSTFGRLNIPVIACPPSAPVGVTVLIVNATAMLVTWHRASLADLAQCEVTAADSGAVLSRVTAPAARRAILIPHLTLGTAYSFRVALLSSSGQPLGWSFPLVRSLLLPPSPPRQPSASFAFHLQHRNSSGVAAPRAAALVRWQPSQYFGGSASLTYTVLYWEVSLPSPSDSLPPASASTISAGTQLSAVALGLRADVRYLFHVTASNADETSLPSAQPAYLLLTVPQRPSITEAVVLSVVAGKLTVRLSWSFVAGTVPIHHFLVQHAASQAAPGTRQAMEWPTTASATTLQTAVPSLSIPALDARSTYIFRVAAVNQMSLTSVYSAASHPLSVSLPRPPTSLSATVAVASSQLSLRMLWNLPTGESASTGTSALPVRHCSVHLAFPDNTSSAFLTAGLASQLLLELPLQHSSLSIRVSCTNVLGTGPLSRESVKLVLLRPADPRSLVAVRDSAASARLSWDQPGQGRVIQSETAASSSDTTAVPHQTVLHWRLPATHFRVQSARNSKFTASLLSLPVVAQYGSSAQTAVLPELLPRTYHARVTAISALGTESAAVALRRPLYDPCGPQQYLATQLPAPEWHCRPCPEGTTCATAASAASRSSTTVSVRTWRHLVARRGWWTAGDDRVLYSPCPLDSCVGGQPSLGVAAACDTKAGFASAVASSGNRSVTSPVLCGTCAAGHVRQGPKCTACRSTGESFLLLLSSLLLLLGYAMVSERLSRRPRQCSEQLKASEAGSALQRILISFFVVLGSVAEFRARAPDTLRQLLSIPTVVASGVNPSWHPVKCLLGDAGFYAEFWAGLCLPLLVATVALLLCRIMYKVHRPSSSRGPPSATAVLVSLTLLMYPGLCRHLLQVFHCTEASVDGIHYLIADLRVPCYTPTHTATLGFGAALLLLIGCGLPASIIAFVHRNRASLRTPSFRAQYRFIIGGYTTGHSWWGAVVLLRKFAFQCLVVLVQVASTQALVAGYMLMLALLAQSCVRPFFSPLLNAAELASLVVIYLVQSLSFFLSVASPTPAVQQAVMLALLLLCFGFVVSHLCIMARAAVEKRQRSQQNARSGSGTAVVGPASDSATDGTAVPATGSGNGDLQHVPASPHVSLQLHVASAPLSSVASRSIALRQEGDRSTAQPPLATAAVSSSATEPFQPHEPALCRARASIVHPVAAAAVHKKTSRATTTTTVTATAAGAAVAATATTISGSAPKRHRHHHGGHSSSRVGAPSHRKHKHRSQSSRTRARLQA